MSTFLLGSQYRRYGSNYPKYVIKRLSKQKRTSSIGAATNFKHLVEDRFLKLLVYNELYNQLHYHDF